MLSRSDRRGLRPRDRSDSGRTVCGAGELAWPALPRGRQGGAVTVMLEEATAEWTSSLRDLPFEKETLLFSALFRIPSAFNTIAVWTTQLWQEELLMLLLSYFSRV